MEESHSEFISDLFHKFYPQMMIYARSALFSQTLAEEAVQEAFHIACSKPDLLQESENPKGWMINTLRYIIFEMRRREAKQILLMESFDSDIHNLPDKKEISQNLELIYGDLCKTREFQLVKMLAVEGKTISQISAELGISEVACRKRMERARKFLRSKL